MSYKIEVITLDNIIANKLLVLYKNTFDHTTVCKNLLRNN